MSNLHRRFLRSTAYTPRTITVNGKSAVGNCENVSLKLSFNKIVGKGTFGCIEQAFLNDSKEPVAVKKVFQDPRYKNRELNILLSLSDHPNLVRLLYYYYTSSQTNKSSGGSNSTANNTEKSNSSVGNSNSGGDIYLHLVMECFPESLADLISRYNRQMKTIPILNIKLYGYQLLRALGYIHLQNICHRDIKSSNLLVDEVSGRVKLCDFGSAKEMLPGQTNVAYISSRYYRAPELIFGAEIYECSIDIWSAGCVIAELILRKCLFMGSDSVDQLAEIIKVLGTPSLSDVQAMNPRYSSYSFPNVPRCPLRLYLPMETPTDLIHLLSQMLVYRPNQRVQPLQALLHGAFSVLRTNSDSCFSKPADLFEFTAAELAGQPDLSSLAPGGGCPSSSTRSLSTSSATSCQSKIKKNSQSDYHNNCPDSAGEVDIIATFAAP